MKRIFPILFLVICTISRANNVQITFSADTETNIDIYNILDCSYNNYVITDSLRISPNKSIVYTIPINGFSVIKLCYNKQATYILHLLPQNDIELICKNNILQARGNNAIGISYFNKTFIRPGFVKHTHKVQKKSIELIESGIPLKNVTNKALYHAMHDIEMSLDSLLRNNSINKEFMDILKEDLQIAFYSRIIDIYKSNLIRKNIRHEEARTEIERIFSICSIHKKGFHKHYFASQFTYNYYAWQKPNQKFIKFKGLSQFFSAPEKIQSSYLGRSIVVEKDYFLNTYNHKDLYEYLSEHFPKSDYLPYLKKYFQDNSTGTTFAINYLKQNISSLSELQQIPEFKDKYIFIDLWASWCIPCRKEFIYNKQLQSVLKKYQDINILYISIDDDNFAEAWNNCIEHYKLKGIHLRASKELKENIKAQIYGSEEFTIPRYALLAPDGEVLHNNLPRPSNYTAIDEELKKILK